MTNDTLNPTTEPLLPCPFCGSKAVLRHHPGNGYFVVCTNDDDDCGMDSGYNHATSSVVAAWNRRALPPVEAAQATGVKPLDWSYNSFTSRWEAQSILGEWRAWDINRWRVAKPFEKAVCIVLNVKAGREQANEEYTALILSALTSPPRSYAQGVEDAAKVADAVAEENSGEWGTAETAVAHDTALVIARAIRALNTDGGKSLADFSRFVRNANYTANLDPEFVTTLCTLALAELERKK